MTIYSLHDRDEVVTLREERETFRQERNAARAALLELWNIERSSRDSLSVCSAVRRIAGRALGESKVMLQPQTDAEILGEVIRTNAVLRAERDAARAALGWAQELIHEEFHHQSAMAHCQIRICVTMRRALGESA